jgi:hypothetical protein
VPAGLPGFRGDWSGVALDLLQEEDDVVHAESTLAEFRPSGAPSRRTQHDTGGQVTGGIGYPGRAKR